MVIVMTNKEMEYSLKEVKEKAIEFLEEANDSSETTFKNYRTSVNYFIYIMDCNKQRFDKINDDNKVKALNKFKNCLLNGFEYHVESVCDVVGYTEKTFKPANRWVEVKANGVNTHLRRIITFFNNELQLKVKNYSYCDVDNPKYKALTIEHVKLLIDECPNCWKKKEIATRNATLIKILFSNGLRIKEALGITIDDTNFIDYDEETNKAALKPNIDINKDCTVRICQKGRNGKDKELKVSGDVATNIIEYINIKKVPSDYVFSTTQVSTDGKAKPLSRQYFNKDVNKLAKFVDERYNTKTTGYDNISDVVKNNSSHVFRHSFGVDCLERRQLNIRIVQKAMRHKSLNSTMIYTDPSEKIIDKIYLNNDI